MDIENPIDLIKYFEYKILIHDEILIQVILIRYFIMIFNQWFEFIDDIEYLIETQSIIEKLCKKLYDYGFFEIDVFQDIHDRQRNIPTKVDLDTLTLSINRNDITFWDHTEDDSSIFLFKQIDYIEYMSLQYINHLKNKNKLYYTELINNKYFITEKDIICYGYIHDIPIQLWSNLKIYAIYLEKKMTLMYFSLNKDRNSRTNLDQDKTCCICLEQILIEDSYITTCGIYLHPFHKSCLSQWLTKFDSCPICRRTLDIRLSSSDIDQEYNFVDSIKSLYFSSVQEFLNT